ncbi:BlaI/MecI/CopY family transcriptional regulator [Lysobacter enzymogenes]|uniref:BlaI/MecI/CopY family transcriptional regulator n=1 Tax=Lysobacter enzymogenes TaxID=69 RepID=UPI001AF1E784|nr:BlaI/MecI/CopY family transcriptional regulator [Lysobacter enzymogenes]QQQ03537.1 BlaI/MecI/CopY family transcriptional regulator [Lysobacter enzymogenes]
MARPSSPTPTPSEQAILEVLWDRGEASVREVADTLSQHKPVAYTTVLTTFNVLAKKGFVTHRQEGRAFVYRAAISREQARRQALDQLLLRFFEGSPNLLAQHLLDQDEVGRDELKALRAKVEAAKQRGNG